MKFILAFLVLFLWRCSMNVQAWEYPPEAVEEEAVEVEEDSIPLANVNKYVKTTISDSISLPSFDLNDTTTLPTACGSDDEDDEADHQLWNWFLGEQISHINRQANTALHMTEASFKMIMHNQNINPIKKNEIQTQMEKIFDDLTNVWRVVTEKRQIVQQMYTEHCLMLLKQNMSSSSSSEKNVTHTHTHMSHTHMSQIHMEDVITKGNIHVKVVELKKHISLLHQKILIALNKCIYLQDPSSITYALSDKLDISDNKSYMTDRGVIMTESERLELLHWAQGILTTGGIARQLPHGRSDFTLHQNDTRVPPLVWQIKSRIEEREGLHSFRQEPLFQDFLGIIHPGGMIHNHRDTNTDDLIHSRFNVIIQQAGTGYVYYAGRQVYVREGGYVFSRSGLDFHWTDINKSPIERFSLSFGYLLPQSFINEHLL